MKTLKYIFIFILTLTIVLNAQSERENNDFSYALKLYNQQFYDLSAKQFLQFYNSYPSSTKLDEAKYYAGLSYFKLQEFNKARSQFQGLALEFAKSRHAAESWFKVGECDLRLGDTQSAIKSFETIYLLYPKDTLAPQGLYEAGKLFLQNKHPNRAISSFNMILSRYHESSYYFPAMVRIAEAYFTLKNYEKALTFADHIIKSAADDDSKAEAFFILGRLAMVQGRNSDARQKILTVLNEYPKTSIVNDAVLTLSELYILNQEYNQANKILNKYSKVLTDSLSKQRAKELGGDTDYLQKKYALAEKLYREATLLTTSDSLRTIFQLKTALSEWHQGLKEKSEETLQTLIGRKSIKNLAVYPYLQRLYINWLIQSDKRKQAIGELKQTLNLVDTDHLYDQNIITLFKLLKEEGEWGEMIRLIQTPAALSLPLQWKDDLLFYRALAYEHLHKYEQSLTFYDQIISDFASSQYYQQALEHRHQLITFKITDLNQALYSMANLFAEYLDQNNKAEAQFALAKIYMDNLKNFDKAEQLLKRALRTDSLHRGDIHLSLGKIYLTLSEADGLTSNAVNEYINLARDEFKEALKAAKTCSAPDEASWGLIKAMMSNDSLSDDQEKNYIERLIKEYPQSVSKEKWYQTLAVDLSFSRKHLKDSMKYFKLLLTEYKNSSDYAGNLYHYAHLLQSTDEQQAIADYKEIALNYPMSPVAASALQEVAKFYEQNKQYHAALQLYNKLIRQYEYTWLAEEAGDKIGPLYFKEGKYEQAIQYLKEKVNTPFLNDLVLHSEFSSGFGLENLFYLAASYQNTGRFKSALQYYNLYLRSGKDPVILSHIRYNLGEIYARTGQKNLAVANFLNVSSADTALYRSAKANLARIYFDQKEYDKAAAMYRDLTRMKTGKKPKAEFYEKYIISLIRSGKLKESKSAVQRFKKSGLSSKNHLAAFVLEYGQYNRKNKNFNRAIKFFKEVKKKYKSTEYVDDADYYLALTYITLNKVEDAFKILSTFYQNHPRSNQLPAALNTLGNLYFRGEKYDNAITMFKNALKGSRDEQLTQNILSNLIKTYTLTGFWDAAQGLARKYIEEFPQAADVLDKKIIIARAYINLNQYQNAVDYLKKIKLEADADREPEIQFYIGDALMKAGQYENAIAEYVKIPLLSKKTKLQWEASALYYAGQCYEKLGRTSDAVRMYREIVRRPGIDLVLKKEAQKRIKQIQ